MGDSSANIFSKIVLMEECDISPLLDKEVTLEIDMSYTIGRSIAVLKDGTIIGHLDRMVTRVVWRYLRSGAPLKAKVYTEVCGWRNKPWFCILTHSFEIGVQINFLNLNLIKLKSGSDNRR